MQRFFARSPLNPILHPVPEHEWESKKVYNCGALYRGGQYHLYYRAMGEGMDWSSAIGYGVSYDGEHFARFAEPALRGEGGRETRGVEDPRIVKIEETYFMTYTAYDGECARLSLATSLDLKTWDRHGEMMPDWDAEQGSAFKVKWDEGSRVDGRVKRKWSKAGGIFPETVGGTYWMLFGDSNMWLATSEDGLKWEPMWEPFIRPREGKFDSVHVEMGPPPIKTAKGWLVLYHGIDEKIVYRIGFLLLDMNDPQKILYRSDEPIFEPQESYELSGIVDILPGGLKKLQRMSKEELGGSLSTAEVKGFMPKVTFCNGAVLVGDTLRIYYGASDSVVCTATADMYAILASANT